MPLYNPAPTKLIPFTPTWKGGVSDPVLGNGTLSGRYGRDADFLFVAIDLVMGSTTTYGSGYWYFLLPLGLSATAECGGYGRALDNGVAEYYGYMAIGSGANQIVGKYNGNSIQPTFPFTFGTADELHLSGWVAVG